jgi:hypothetical protein
MSLSAGKQKNTSSGTSSGVSNTIGSGSGKSWVNPYGQAGDILNWLGTNILGQANTPSEFYPGQTYAGPSDATKRSWEMGTGQVMDQYQGANQGYQNASAAYSPAANSFNNAAGAFDTSAGAYGAAGQGYQNVAPAYGNAANAVGASAGAQAGAANTALGNYNFLSGAADVANNPYVQGQIGANERSVMKNFMETALPKINQGAQQVNALGSSRQGMLQGQAMGDAAEALANTNASTMLNAYGQGLNAQQGALGQLGNLQAGFQRPGEAMARSADLQKLGADMGRLNADMQALGADQKLAGANARLTGADALTTGADVGKTGADMMQAATDFLRGIGGDQEAFKQLGIDENIARHNFGQEEPWMRMQNVGNLLGIFNPYAGQGGKWSSKSNTTSSMEESGKGSSTGIGFGK